MTTIAIDSPVAAVRARLARPADSAEGPSRG